MTKPEEKILIKNPIISVIITAHDRKEFLKDAIQSVLKQSFDKSLYEIIVIKNFSDFEIDRIIDENDILSLKSSKKSLVGDDLYSASKSASGEILCFLDDDDMFSSNKLENVYNVFVKDKSVIYYHNLQQSGKFSKHNSHNIGLFKKNFTHTELIRNLPSLIRTYGSPVFFFNLSSISIRKQAYLKHLQFLNNLSIHPDDFFFFVGLEIGGNFYFDDLQLTIYRIHSSNTSIIRRGSGITNHLYLERKGNLFENYVQATSYILSILSNKEIKKYLGCREVIEKLQENFYRNKTTFVSIIKTLRCYRCNGLRYTVWLILHLIKDRRDYSYKSSSKNF